MDDFVDDLRQLFENEYILAKKERLHYEVQYGKESNHALRAFEKSFTHVAAIFTGSDKAFELKQAKDHLQKLAVELVEYRAEEELSVIRYNLDPCRRNRYFKFLCVLLHVKSLELTPEQSLQLDRLHELIAEARSLKGLQDAFSECYSKFTEAYELGKSINRTVPQSRFYERYFALKIAFLCLILGWLLGLIPL